MRLLRFLYILDHICRHNVLASCSIQNYPRRWRREMESHIRLYLEKKNEVLISLLLEQILQLRELYGVRIRLLGYKD